MVMPLPMPRLTIDMLDDFPEDGTRYELLEGMLLVTPAPSFAHQVVATRWRQRSRRPRTAAGRW